jgi:hypothetical protein
MATKTNLPAVAVAGNVLTATYVNDLRGAFRILQLFSVQGSTQQTSTTTTYADITGLTVTITPQATTNKILIVAANHILCSSDPANSSLKIVRNSTDIFSSIQLIGGVGNSGGSWSSIYLDSPATTSATTYKMQFNRSSGIGTVYSNVSGGLSNLLVCEISA